MPRSHRLVLPLILIGVLLFTTGLLVFVRLIPEQQEMKKAIAVGSECLGAALIILGAWLDGKSHS